MVLGNEAHPLQRIWCLFEVKRAADFGAAFDLVMDDGPVAKAPPDVVRALVERLRGLRAFDANASQERDKHMIRFRIMDRALRQGITKFDLFLTYARKGSVESRWFDEFDDHVCALLRNQPD